MAFYTQALEGTRHAFGRLQSMGIPFLRPPDYHAEMVKRQRRGGKQGRRRGLQKKSRPKSSRRESSKRNMKLNLLRSGGSSSRMEALAEGEGFERPKKMRPGVAPGDRSGGKARHARKFGKGSGKGGKSREYRNMKFGHGGKKGLRRQNNAESANVIRGFNKGLPKRISKGRGRANFHFLSCITSIP
ncbi:hypothetical protein AMTR_s00010p00120630 [Amborella trichopoda]|uniref:Uncharacterized protein n=1 Tax=Amborella trichopoda TaxID=13333 RepID=W1NF69_AMBTC|nr:hypothetical protein AMTR_s00010p00120630 [Amborella trichopoda]